ncbi:MAG: inositol monophosphatase [Tistrella sp.]|uniref:Inositol-1-monophosphatase n=1 Tax=Tistrella mobilis TaxID=171437 RepID=A0A162KGE8_9PROT|nr:inositol monophosphatase family protein [Tistrella mobilis]KYO51212.1 inositol monophosphatase [Tistrella mobilis]MBA78950.1 inositol monophosphatase [Tistrella sp.]
MAIRSPILNVMIGAAQKAARGLIRDFGEVENLQVSRKGPADFVSSADLKSEKVLRAELAKARPDFGFLMEEGGEVKGSGDGPSHRWIIDPLDGTHNFLHGIPHFAVTVALEREGEIIAGVTYDPLRDEMFSAEKGYGAFVNDRRIRVAARRQLIDCVVATGIPRADKPNHTEYLKMLAGMMKNTGGIRRFGSAALDLAYVAAGRFDAFFELDLQPWDMAAGVILVREAGGFVSDLTGGDGMLTSGHIIAGNTTVHGQTHKVLSTMLARRPRRPGEAPAKA